MNPARATAENYIDFLVASPKQATATGAADCQPEGDKAPAHDAFTRLLLRLEPDAETLWREAQTQVSLNDGVLVLDDSVLDKPHAKQIELVQRHWSGKHHRVVQGIDLVTLLWTDGDRLIPCDYRIYHDAAEATKNDHFRQLLAVAKSRGFQPKCVLFDTWYSSIENLKFIRAQGWRWLTRVKSNRLVNVDRGGLRPVSAQPIESTGTVAWLKGYGMVKIFKIVATDGDVAYWVTSDLTMTDLERLTLAERSWAIETYHKAIKQCVHIERCQSRSAKAQRNHINLALRAFLRFELHFFTTGISWFRAKVDIVRPAIRAYLANPTLNMASA
jgi:putative transposase